MFYVPCTKGTLPTHRSSRIPRETPQPPDRVRSDGPRSVRYCGVAPVPDPLVATSPTRDATRLDRTPVSQYRSIVIVSRGHRQLCLRGIARDRLSTPRVGRNQAACDRHTRFHEIVMETGFRPKGGCLTDIRVRIIPIVHRAGQPIFQNPYLQNEAHFTCIGFQTTPHCPRIQIHDCFHPRRTP